MKEERLLRALTQIDAQLIQAHDPALAENAAKPRKHRPLRIALIAAAVAALLVTAAMAISPSFRDMILTSLGFRAPYATEALGSCEDRGVTIEAQKALADGRASFLYFTVHDPTGVFFLEDTYNFLTVDFLVDGEKVPGNWRFDCRGEPLERLSYDPETQTALYLFRAGIVTHSTEESPVPTHARISMDRYLPGKRLGNATYHGPSSISKRQDKLIAPTEVLESTQENGATVLLPEQNPQPIDEHRPEVYISSMGFASDGYYHVRLHQDPNVTQAWNDDADFHEPFGVLYLLQSEDGKTAHQYNRDDMVSTPVSDGWDYCLTSLTQENFERVLLLSVDTYYSVSGGYVTGDWSLTVPVSPVEHRTAKPEQTLILSETKDSPPPSGISHEAQVAAVSVSTLSVTADFVRPENYNLCADVRGQETACAVTLADGTVLSPTYLAQGWSGNGWVMWEFAEPIDPSEVVSVALNGNEIPFPAE